MGMTDGKSRRFSLVLPLIPVVLLLLCLVIRHTAGSDRPWERHLNGLQPSASPQQQEDAVRGLLQRLLKERAAQFNITVDPSLTSEGKDAFNITATNGTAHITGSSGVSASSGVLYYLKYTCNCHVSWEADQLYLPPTLPDAEVQKTAMERFRYYFNICTLSYSTPFWTWPDWERGIDWMALNGINLVLAPSGQEDSWRRVFLSLGMTDDDLAGFFAGPPFLAWNRMGNIQGWGGPLSQHWLSNKAALNKKIVSRMREFGMMAILPAFAGHVPAALQRLFPSANISRLSTWGHFTDPYTRTYFLDPRDPLFNTIGSAFIKEMNVTFGTDHIYSSDPFNEMLPVSSDPAYLASLGSAFLNAMISVDPKAVWVMQGWMFVNDPGFWQPPQVKALLTSVPQGRMLILDLASEILPQYRRFESFYGQPFVFCMLHNYGGVQGLFGNVDVMMRYLKTARGNTTANANITLVGTGLTPEGINQNYVMYDLFTELTWTPDIDVPHWSLGYARRRYGSSDVRLGKAWQILMDSVYNSDDMIYNHGQYILVTQPNTGRQQDKLWYSVSDLVEAWDLIIAVVRNSSSQQQQQQQQQQEISSTLRNPSQEKEGVVLNLPSLGLTNKPKSPSLSYWNEFVNIPLEADMKYYKRKRREGERRRMEKWREGERRRREKRSVAFTVERIESREERAYANEMGELKRRINGIEVNGVAKKGKDGMEGEENVVEKMSGERGREGKEINGVIKKGKDEMEEENVEKRSDERGREVEHTGNIKTSADVLSRGGGVKLVTEQDTFKHDLVDVTRQMLQVIGGNMALRLIDDYKNGVLLALKESRNLLHGLLQDMEELLASSPDFLLGKWVDGAATWAANEEERVQLVRNALHQISLWGPTGEILDYAIKQWSGVFSNYHLGRWELFGDRLEDSLVTGTPFDQLLFNLDVFSLVEKPFAMDTNTTFPTQPKGDTVSLALRLYEKYRPVFTSDTLSDFEQQFNDTRHKMEKKKKMLEEMVVDEGGVDVELNLLRWMEEEEEMERVRVHKELEEEIQKQMEENMK
ncbi:hypothetical protein Pmani_014921 [Petrolisthes manimaculis]|uniref:Alpha-N-acetylglucosaminidase n=1 Tax=Petrolisthes manimaculis TaxID=1843537 RepID=A0AAE1PTB4_9EUCA|nr:hypothetical protein Pmani_014921 [Petrolisthes manimaculis]